MHANARLTPIGRLTLVLRIESGRPVAHVAHEMGISRPTAYKWWRRWLELGEEGLVDRSSRAHHCPHRTSPETEAQIAELRRIFKLGPARIGYRLGVAPSTVHRVLTRQGLNRLKWLDRPTGRVIRRYERERPGDLIHVDIKKLGRIPEGGGWRMHGRTKGIARTRTRHGPSGTSVTGSFTRPLTTIAASPTPRSWTTRRRRPPRLLAPSSGLVQNTALRW